MQPVAPIKPPASLPFLRAGGKRVRSSRIDWPDYIGRFFIGWRVEKALQVSAIRQHECRVVAQDARGLVGYFPRRDVVRDAAYDVAVDLAPNLAHVRLPPRST